MGKTRNKVNQQAFCKMVPIKRGMKAGDLLKFAGTWQGDDLEECRRNFLGRDAPELET